MSQKNGHALESVTLTAMLRRWTSSLLLIAVAAAGALSAMILQNLTIRQENALCNTIENTTISCTVTNAKGTDSGNLQMLSAFVEMLEGKRRLRECYLDDYVKNVRAKAKMSLEKPEGATLSRILSIDSDPALSQAEGVYVQFFEDWEEGVLRGQEQVCLISSDLVTDGEYISHPGRVDTYPDMTETFILVKHGLDFPGIDKSGKVVVHIKGNTPYLRVAFQERSQRHMGSTAQRQAITIPFPSLQLLKCRMGKRINRSFKDCHMPAARTLRGITKVISFVAAIDILFEIAADTAHTGKLRFPGIIFPNKHTNRFSMIPGFVKNPGL